MVAGTLLADGAEPFRTDINPALRYYEAFLVAPQALSQADSDYLVSSKGKEKKLPERFAGIVAGSDLQYRVVREAGHAAVRCDWGVDTSAGPNTLLPHLGRAKVTSRTGQLRAVWELEHGKQAEARDDLVAAFVLGRNAGSDALLIGAMVQCAIEDMNYVTVAEHFEEFAPETLQELVAGFDAAPARCTMAACMPSEREFSTWVRNKLIELRKAYPDDDAKVMAGFRGSGLVQTLDSIGYTNFWPRLLAASGGTSEGTLKLLQEMEPLWPRATEIMGLPEPEYENEAKQFIIELHASPNPFVAILEPLFTGWAVHPQRWQGFGTRPREFEAQAELAMVHAALEYKLHGEAGVKSVMDPFGTAPFSYRRFVFKGRDRGFELRSAYAGADAPFVMIFVEKRGPAFEVNGPEAGKAIVP